MKPGTYLFVVRAEDHAAEGVIEVLGITGFLAD